MTFITENLDPNDVSYTFRTLESESKLVPGEQAYIISFDWLKKFKQQQYGEITCGPINNNDLLKKGKFNQENMIENYHFSILTCQVWKQLKEWFGGGPEISFSVVNTSKGPRVVLSQLNLKFHYKNIVKSITTHKYINIANLKQQVLSEFGLPPNKESRIVDYWKEDIKSILEDEEDLEKYQIYNDQDMLLDTKNEDDEWDSVYAKKKKESPNSVHRKNAIEYYGAPNNNNNYDYNNNNNNINNINSINNNQFNNQFNKLHSPGFFPYDSGYRREIEKAIGPGIVGLTDLGNTCFFNSGVQCLMHTVPLMKIFLHSAWKRDLNNNNPIGMGGNLAKTFAELAERFWSGEEKFISPNNLKYMIGQFAPQFSGYGQQDAHELITFMLDGIHEDLNRCIQKPIVQNINGDGKNDDTISATSWNSFKSRNDSVIIDNFYGQYRSRLVCPECNSITVVFDPFVALTLPISKGKKLKARFIPKDFLQKPVKVNVFLSKNASYNEFRQQILSKIDRPDLTIENLVICDWHFGKASWGTNNDSMGILDLYAFEVGDPSKYYAATYMKMGFSDQFAPHLEIGPFLLQFDTNSPSKQDIDNSAQILFSSFWESRDDIELPESVTAYKESLIGESTNYNYNNNYAFKIDLGFNGSYQNQELHFDKTDPQFSHFSKVSPQLYLNQEYMTKSAHFSLNPFLSKIKPPKTSRMKGVKLSRCFKLFSRSDRLDDDNKWFCPKCQQFVCAEKKMDVWRVPNCLIIHLKRFSTSEFSQSKDNTPVDYPHTLDLRNYVVGPQKNEPHLTYNLYGVSEHMGGLAGGHYTAHAKVVQDGETDGTWWSFDNENTTRAMEEAAINSDAYLLFYQRNGLNNV